MMYQGIISWVLDSFLCLAMLGGVGAGFYLISKKQKTPGILGLIGFFLLGLNMLIKVLVYGVFLRQIAMTPNINIVQTTMICVQGLLMFLGIAALIAALLMVAKNPQSKAS